MYPFFARSNKKGVVGFYTPSLPSVFMRWGLFAFRDDVHGCTNVVNAGCVGTMNVHPDLMDANEGVVSAAEVLSLG